jgi:hypothetical protein
LFLWNSIPDDALLDDAIAGRLSEPKVLEAQVRRMLADARAETLVTDFAEQWLQLRIVNSKAPDERKFPTFDDNLRRDMLHETELFLRSVLLENRSVLDLIRADYTFVNERLAEHYGVDGVFGDAFRRVELRDPNRRGLLGQGSILFQSSVANRTSPVFRGKWIMTVLFNAPPPPPPPNVPPLVETKDADHPMTMKERMEEHRRNPVCANCHRLMDPIGLALENYDGIGAARVRDHGVKIDASTQLADGTSVNGVNELRQAILKRSDIFVRTFTENLLTYAVGRGLGGEDMPAVRTILRNTAPQHYRMEDIVQAIVTSTPFQMRIKPAAAGEAAH